MSRIFIRLALLLMLCSGTVRAGLDATVLDGLASSDFETRIAAIEALALGEEAGSRVVAALEAGEFGTVTIAPAEGEAGVEPVVRAVLLQAGKVIDPASGEALDIAASAVTPLRLNNRLRRALATAKAGLTLESGTDAERRAAADVLLGSPSKALLPLFERVIETEEISSIRDVV